MPPLSLDKRCRATFEEQAAEARKAVGPADREARFHGDSDPTGFHLT